MVSVERAGVDTWKPAWYVSPGSSAARGLAAMASVRSAGGLMLLPDAIDGHRIGWYPQHGLAIAEGHPDETGLCRPDQLPQRLCDLELNLWDHGLPVEPDLTRSRWGGVLRPQTADRLPGFAGVARCDTTADLRFERSAEGLATMAGIAAVGMPRMKVQTWRGLAGSLETVSFHGPSGGRIVARVYDKGVESSTARRGQLIRPEDQRRYGGQTRRGVDELTNAYVHDKFAQRFQPLWRASEGVTVAGPPILFEKVAQLLDEGLVTPTQAEQLIGYAALRDCSPDSYPRTTSWRRRQLAREHGLVLADAGMDEVEIDLSGVLDVLMDSSAWGRDQ